jgi:hypothetical protein
MSVQLKIKIHTLADEGRHIKRWTSKLKKRRHAARKKEGVEGESRARAQQEDPRLRIGDDLYWHRIGVVRPAARICNLANGFLRGVPYEKMEGRCEHPPNFDKVEKEARRFSAPADWGKPDGELQHAWKIWLKDAKCHLDPQQKIKWAAEEARLKAKREADWEERKAAHRRRELAQLRSLAASHPEAVSALAAGDEEALKAAGVPTASETKHLARRTRPVRTYRTVSR